MPSSLQVAFNGKITQAQKVWISPLGAGFRHGYGLFETLKIAKGCLYYFEEHWERLCRGCSQLYMQTPCDPEGIRALCLELASLNTVDFGAARIIYFKNEKSDDLLITVEPRHYKTDQYDRGFNVQVAATRRDAASGLLGVKTLNYLGNALARESALQQSYDEALFLNTSGHICEGAISNIFFAKAGILYTPSKECGLLPGVLRAKVIDLAKELGLTLNIGAYPLHKLDEADEVFLTNALLGIMPVSHINDRRFDLTCNPLTQRLTKQLRIHEQQVTQPPSQAISKS